MFYGEISIKKFKKREKNFVSYIQSTFSRLYIFKKYLSCMCGALMNNEEKTIWRMLERGETHRRALAAVKYVSAVSVRQSGGVVRAFYSR